MTTLCLHFHLWTRIILVVRYAARLSYLDDYFPKRPLLKLVVLTSNDLFDSYRRQDIIKRTMELEQKNPLQLLVQSVTKQQQTKSDLTSRLAHLVLVLAKHNREIASLVDEEKSLRLQLAEIARGNLHLEEMNTTMLQNCDAEHQTRSSLALTLDSLNEKKLSLEEAVITKKQLYDDDLSKQRSLLEIEGKALADLIDGEEARKYFMTALQHT